MGDALFILLHLALVFTPLSAAKAFYLDVDGGVAEWYQYLKLALIAWLLAVLARQQRQPLYTVWLALFAFLLLDDALRLHETAGLWLANQTVLPPLVGLRPRDLGELLLTGMVALSLLTALVLAYQASQARARCFSQFLILALLALGIVGVGMDMLEQMATGWHVLHELLIVIEDGGELIVVSVMIWLVYREAREVKGWTAVPERAGLQTIAVGLALLAVCTAVFAYLQYSTPALVGNDGYYHAKMGLLVRQQGLTPTPPQLPLTILNEAEFYNHHLLFHLYLALFAQTDPALDGGLALTQQVKAATVILATLPFLAIWWLLRGQGVRGAALWTLALFALSGAFLYRLSMTRAQSASLLVLVLALHWLFQGKYRRLLPLAVLYVWLYDAFPLLLVVCGVYFGVLYVTERRLAWPVLLYPAAGIGIGLVVNPYFPQNLTFIARHLLPKLWDGSGVRVGNEWYPYDSWVLLQNAGLALGLFLLTLLLLNWRGRRMDGRILTLFVLAVLFGLMLFRARRFVEYFPAFVLLFAAVSLSPLLVAWAQERPLRRYAVGAGLALFLLPVVYTVRDGHTAVAASTPADRYAAAALWLKAYSPPGSMVFQTDWDDFTRLFFYDSDNQYTVGLDPTYLSLQDMDLYNKWVQITRGEVQQPSLAMKERFNNAAYVFSDLNHDAFLREAAKDPGLQEIYRDESAVIFAVQSGETTE
ncbi:MAG: hypothetical protein BroJett015_39520 [Chloroflexota bacterium]|nr:hypothetical protein [Chloroflexota bacterium]GIK58289.1 MAG: hypothetical protein BroJett015_39520 [Chloroflexota bacterium]